MKKVKTMKTLFSTVLLITLGIGVTACGDDHDGDETPQLNVGGYLAGKEWNLDGQKTSAFSFYKNHLVVCDGGASTTTGGLAGGLSLFYGTWNIVDNKLNTTFTSGSYMGFDWNKLLYGTLSDAHIADNLSEIYSTRSDKTLTVPVASSYIVGKDTGGDYHYLQLKKSFTDYTDESEHDTALHGVWYMEAQNYTTNKVVNCTMTVNADGTVCFNTGDGIEFTTNYTTKNGHVKFDSYLVRGNSQSYIYLRTDTQIQLVNESNALTVWRWKK